MMIFLLFGQISKLDVLIYSAILSFGESRILRKTAPARRRALRDRLRYRESFYL